jgi:hypothetical protein
LFPAIRICVTPFHGELQGNEDAPAIAAQPGAFIGIEDILGKVPVIRQLPRPFPVRRPRAP